ncbi:MAG: preQ(1) synthase [Fimbriimonadales bacterium]|nr:preQ(1) synthase [Fimbriimonadales bacterium]
MSRDLLETFPNPSPERDYVIRHVAPEFTSVCPKTGNPDFGTIVVTYIPESQCLELKAFKMYLFSYRNKGIFYEAVVNQILEDLVAVAQPRFMRVTGIFNVRGGIYSTVTAEYHSPSWQGSAPPADEPFWKAPRGF